MRTIQKPLAELTLSDLELSPVWEFALDDEGQDEATVSPYELRGELDPAAGMFIVRARFRLANGTFVDGYVRSSQLNGEELRRTQPVIITPSGQIEFWFGASEPRREQVAEGYRKLGEVDPGAVFPIYFLSIVPIRTGAVAGAISGFAGPGGHQHA